MYKDNNDYYNRIILTLIVVIWLYPINYNKSSLNYSTTMMIIRQVVLQLIVQRI